MYTGKMGVPRSWLPQLTGSPSGLKGGGDAPVVPPVNPGHNATGQNTAGQNATVKMPPDKMPHGKLTA